jgi:hypothetical protein
MKRNIVIAEILYPIGHKPIDNKIIEILSKNYSLTVLNYQEYFNDNAHSNIKYVELPKQIIISKHEPLIRAGILFNLLVIKKALKNVDYDTILFLSCNNAMLKTMSMIFAGKRILVMHHNDIDAIKTEKQLKVFRKGMNSVEHITVADYISKGLERKTGCLSSRIFTVPHPITSRVLEYDQLKNRERMLVGLGLSNDENFIDACIDIDQKSPKDLSYKIILRSTKKEYRGNNLTVINGYLDDETYNNYYYHAEAIVICYPKHFENRYSATMIFAVAQNGKVIFNDFPMGREESKKYPHIMRVVKQPKELFEIDDSFFGLPVDYNERLRFLDDHSDKRVAEALAYSF